MSELFHVTVPTSASCPHYWKGKLVEGHKPLIGRDPDSTLAKRRSRSPRCKNCKRVIEWDATLQMFVLPYTIEELPW